MSGTHDISNSQGIAVVTGVSRAVGIGLAVAQRLAADGFVVASAGWRGYDERMDWGADDQIPETPGPFYEIDFQNPTAADALFDRVTSDLGAANVLVLCHCESVDSDIYSTTVEAFDRHMAVNARATWQLIKRFAEQLHPLNIESAPNGDRSRRIVSITSDHTAHNLAYGASKGAMDRIVLAAAIELAELGVTSNVINPGATDTGWMNDEVISAVQRINLQPRIGQPADTANLVSFLCSDEGQWINGQLLYSDGGLRR